VKMYCGPLGIYYEVLKDQYQHAEAGFEINKGDYVIDAGACIGDSSFFFAHRVGPHGKVFAFEMLPENLRVLYKNMELNSAHISNVTVVEKPVSETSGKEFFIFEDGPASQLREVNESSGKEGVKVTSISIDDFVERNHIEKIDMIKMDVEGSELSALKGAVNTIKKFKPKLAICVYHKECDFDEIPKFIDSLGIYEKYNLKHHGIQLGETVLYCMA